MKALKFILFLVLGLVVLFLILGLFAPRRIDVFRERSMQVPVEKAFRAVSDLRSWKHWSPWRQRDSTLKVVYGEKSSGKGASYSWVSEHSGSGKYEITEVVENESLASKIRFENQGEAEGYWIFESLAPDETKVRWGLRFDVPYPFNAFMLFQDVDKAVGADFDSGLDNLKAYLESQAEQIGAYTVRREAWGLRHYVALEKEDLAQARVSAFLGDAYAQIGMFLGQNGIVPAGAPTGLYFKWDEENGTTDMAAAMSVKTLPDELTKNLSLITIEEDSALVIDYYGGYTGIAQAHYIMDRYLKEHDLVQKIPVVEEYLTDPGSEVDSTKWHTRIFYFYE